MNKREVGEIPILRQLVSQAEVNWRYEYLKVLWRQKEK